MPPQERIMRTPWTLVLDFDGTLTTRDADVVIAEAVLGPAQRGFIDQLIRDYEALRVTTAEYFERYLERLGLTPAGFAARVDAVELRPGLGALLAWCEAEGVLVHVASEGLDVYIRPILARAGAGALPLTCNAARWDGARFHVETAPQGEPCARCLTCKGALVRHLQAVGQRVALVGNGASDLCGARHADLVCARDSLRAHCAEAALPHVVWSTFEDVRAALDRHPRSLRR
jgi:2,3-diketo-5-methylthio-1-phosphopentane phosphatase